MYKEEQMCSSEYIIESNQNKMYVFNMFMPYIFWRIVRLNV